MGLKHTATINIFKLPYEGFNSDGLKELFYNNIQIYKTPSGASLFERTVLDKAPEVNTGVRVRQENPGLLVNGFVLPTQVLRNSKKLRLQIDSTDGVKKLVPLYLSEKSVLSSRETGSINFIDKKIKLADGTYIIIKLTFPEEITYRNNLAYYEQVRLSLAVLLSSGSRETKGYVEFLRKNLLTRTLISQATIEFLKLYFKTDKIPFPLKNSEDPRSKEYYGVYEYEQKLTKLSKG